MITDEARYRITIARLCEKYHCLPSDLEKERADDIETLLYVMGADAQRENNEVRKLKK